jgi:acyl-CoA thioester hydrolase
MSSFTTTRRVEFHDTDAAGIMHFASFFPLVETVEHEFLRSLGMSVMNHGADGLVSWPRVSATCDYRGAVQFEDVLDITLTLARLGEKSVTYRYEIDHAGRRIAEATIVVVCCRMLPDRKLESLVIPKEWADKLRPYVKS